jgi:hypothetical protein
MMLRPTKVAAALLALTAMTLLMSTAKANLVTIIDDKDATIYQNNPNNSNGAGYTMFAGDNGAGSPRRALLEFNIAANVPKGATINSVQLTLVLQGVAGQGGGHPDTTPRMISLHTLLANWGEGTTGKGMGGGGTGQGFPAHKGDATWSQNFFEMTSWEHPGGDFTAAASASATVSENLNSPYKWGSTSGMVKDVQSWLKSPGTNFGWILIGAEASSQTFRQFYTREEANAAFRPELQIKFTPALDSTPAPVPEPSTLLPAGLGALVGAGCWWRRRRAAVA